jgi:hypothetical protein
MTAAFPYTRLGPRTPHLLGHDSLWLSDDHLLAVHNRRFVEEYQRFELREIQAIVISKQGRFVIPVYWAVTSVTLLIAVIVGKVRGNAALTNDAWAILGLLGVYWLVTSLFRSCSCQLQTAVGAYSLPGLYRIDAAKRVLRTLEARISEVQGALPEDWTADESPDDVTLHVAAQTPSNSATRAATIVAMLACLALFIDALSSWHVRRPNVSQAFRTLNVFITLIAVVLPIVAMVFTRRDRLFRPLRILFMIAVVIVGFVNYGSVVVTVMVTAFQTARQQPPLNTGDFFYWVNQIAEVSLGTLGLLQLLFIAQGRHPSAP